MKKRLEAVNKMLAVVGEPPLINEDDYQLSDEAQQASTELDRVKRTYLARGYKFNTRESVELSPDVNGYIHVPASAIDVIPENPNLIIHEGLLMDVTTSSLLFTKSENVKVIIDYDFDYLPHVLADCILADACLKFQVEKVGDVNISSRLERDKAEALRDLNVWIINNANATYKDNRFSRKSNPK